MSGGTIISLAVLICGSTFGEIAMTYGMKATGEPARLRPKPLLIFLGRAVCKRMVLGGDSTDGTVVLCVIGTAVVGAGQLCDSGVGAELRGGNTGREIYLKEEVNAARWAGVILVCIGVALVAAG